MMARSVKAIRFSDLTAGEQREYLSVTAAEDAVSVQVRDAFFDFETPALRAAFRALPPKHQVILQLRFCEDLSVAEIGTRLFLSATQIRRLATEAIQRLRDSLVAYGIDHADAA